MAAAPALSSGRGSGRTSARDALPQAARRTSLLCSYGSAARVREEPFGSSSTVILCDKLDSNLRQRAPSSDFDHPTPDGPSFRAPNINVSRAGVHKGKHLFRIQHLIPFAEPHTTAPRSRLGNLSRLSVTISCEAGGTVSRAGIPM
jgi:hypothetical protein